MIEINKKDTIQTIIAGHPLVKDLMVELGFQDIVKPGMLQTMGKIMTLEKGARMKGIPMVTIIELFHNNGFQLN